MKKKSEFWESKYGGRYMGRIYSFLKKLIYKDKSVATKSNPEVDDSQDNKNPEMKIPSYSDLTIYGYPADSVDFDNIFPWANNSTSIPNVTIGDTLYLWCVSRNCDPLPKYLRKNYVTDIQKSFKDLLGNGLITDRRKITDKGSAFLKDNWQYIELHKTGWVTPSEKEQRVKKFYKTYDYLIDFWESSGDTETANEIRKEKAEDLKQDEFIKTIEKAEQFSKSGKISESNSLLLPIRNSTNQSVRIYKRLAINYRKSKLYSDEVKIIEEFINDQQPKYGGTAWLDYFEPRLKRAKELERKSLSKK